MVIEYPLLIEGVNVIEYKGYGLIKWGWGDLPEDGGNE